VDAETRKKLGLQEDQGILIRQLADSGPARDAGVQPGDVIVALNGEPTTPWQLRRQLSSTGAGERITLLIARDGKRVTIPLTLAQRPDDG
jgi:S1-C subfamily serine protease